MLEWNLRGKAGWAVFKGDMQPFKSPWVATLLLGVFLLAGCSGTVPGPEARRAPATPVGRVAAQERFPVTRLQRGMTEQQLRVLFGEPQSIEPMEGGDPKARVWTYRREIVKEYRDVLAGTREVPVWAGLNSSSGNSVKMVQEPVTRQELRCVTELTIILMYERSCVNWKQRLEESNGFVN